MEVKSIHSNSSAVSVSNKSAANNSVVNSQRLRDEIIKLFLRNYITNLGSTFIDIPQYFLRNICFIYFSKSLNKYLFFQLQNRRFIFSNYEESVEFRKKLYLFNIHETQIVEEAGINNYIYYLNDEEFRKYCSENLENESKPLIEIETKPFVYDDTISSTRKKKSFPFELPISFMKQFNSDLNKKKKREQYKLENSLKIKNVNQTKLAENTGYIEIDGINNNDVNNTNIHLEKIINENIKIIPNYDKIQARNIDFFTSASHGSVTNKLKTLPNNVFLIVTSPFNRAALGQSYLDILNEIIKFFKQYINIADVNNIYNIIRSIMHSLSFLGSSVYLPNQTYFDLILETNETDAQTGIFDIFGFYKFNDKKNMFELIPSLFKMDESQKISENKKVLLSEIMDYFISTSTPDKYNIYFVSACRSANFNLPIKIVEKLYQYENFMSFLNRSICETLSEGINLIDIPEEIKERIELLFISLGRDKRYFFVPYLQKSLDNIDTTTHENYNTQKKAKIKNIVDYLNNLNESKYYLKNTTLSPIINNNLREIEDRERDRLRYQKKEYSNFIGYNSKKLELNRKKNNLEMTSLNTEELLRLRLKKEKLDKEKKKRFNK